MDTSMSTSPLTAEDLEFQGAMERLAQSNPRSPHAPDYDGDVREPEMLLTAVGLAGLLKVSLSLMARFINEKVIVPDFIGFSGTPFFKMDTTVRRYAELFMELPIGSLSKQTSAAGFAESTSQPSTTLSGRFDIVAPPPNPADAH
jgi:hypothetical protein